MAPRARAAALSSSRVYKRGSTTGRAARESCSCNRGDAAIVHATLDRNAYICHFQQTVCLIKAGKDSFRQVEIGLIDTVAKCIIVAAAQRAAFRFVARNYAETRHGL